MVEERDAHLALQPGDGAAERRLGHPQFLRRLGDVLGAGNGAEVFELLNIHAGVFMPSTT